MTKFYEIFRTALHVLVGLTIGYDVTSLTDFNTYSGVDIIVTGAAGIAGAAIALSWQSDWMFWGLLGASTVFIAREMIHYYKLLRNR